MKPITKLEDYELQEILRDGTAALKVEREGRIKIAIQERMDEATAEIANRMAKKD